VLAQRRRATSTPIPHRSNSIREDKEYPYATNPLTDALAISEELHSKTNPTLRYRTKYPAYSFLVLALHRE
jgi:hypothetical protein